MQLTIREWRRLKDITLEQMSKDFNVTRQTLANWEEHPEKLSFELISRMARYFGIEIADIRFDALVDDKKLSQEV